MAKRALTSEAMLVLAYLCDGHRSEPRLNLRYREPTSSLIAGIGEMISVEKITQTLKRLQEMGYVDLWPNTSNVRITLEGMHFVLVNHALIAERLERFRRCPELLKTSVAEMGSFMGLDALSSSEIDIPAADRFVRVSDNRPAFEEVVRALDEVKAEFARDHNKHQIPLEAKQQAESEIDGLLTQIKKGFVSKVSAKSVMSTLKKVEQVALRVAVAATAIGIAIAAIRKAVGI